MAGKWTITFTEVGKSPGTKAYENEAAFISAVRLLLADIKVSKVSAVLDDGASWMERP
jgi:hypothetical protein